MNDRHGHFGCVFFFLHAYTTSDLRIFCRTCVHVRKECSLEISVSAKSSTVRYKTDGSLVNFRRMSFQSTQNTTEDVDNGHLKEYRAFDVDLHCNTFKIRCRTVFSQAYGGACRRDRTRKTQLPKADTIDFFLGPRKRGVRPHPPNPPWLRACQCLFCVLNLQFFVFTLNFVHSDLCNTAGI